MASVNKVIIIGHLGRDPESRTFDSGDMVANLAVATSETWKDKTTGEKREAVEWHRVNAHGKLHLCLFGNGGHSLRHLLQDRGQRLELQNTIAGLLVQKAPTHLLHFHQSGSTPHLASLGG